MSTIFRRKISLRELFEELEIPQMEMPETDERRTRGRPRYPDKPMLNALMLIPFGVASENELARKLAEIPSLSEDCGFEGLKRIFKRLVSKLVGEGVIHGKAQVVDATPLDAFKSDPDVEWGFKAKDKPFFGYKVSVVSDFKAELPMGIMIAQANQHENKSFKPLVEAAKRHGLRASSICGDAIHDNTETRLFVKSLGAKAFIDQNPGRKRKKEAFAENLQTP